MVGEAQYGLGLVDVVVVIGIEILQCNYGLHHVVGRLGRASGSAVLSCFFLFNVQVVER